MLETGSFKLKYIGRRFEGTRLPVDVLSDLPAIRELIAVFARTEWRRKNPHRKRLPKGFDASFALDLIAIHDGSAAPVLKWNREVSEAYLPGFSDQIEDTINASISEVILLYGRAASGQFPIALEPAQIAALNKFGANLRNDERIEFEGRINAEGKAVFLNANIRKNLIRNLRGRYSAQIEDVGILLGSVASADERDGIGYIVVKTNPQGEFRIPMANEIIKSDFDGNIGQPIELNVQAEFDNRDQISGILEVVSVSLIDEQIAAQLTRCRERLARVAALGDGWHDGSGLGPKPLAVANARRFLELRFSLCELFRIYPTDEGGVLYELAIKNWDISLECLADGKVQFEAVEIEGERTFPLAIFDAVEEKFLIAFDGLTQ